MKKEIILSSVELSIGLQYNIRDWEAISQYLRKETNREDHEIHEKTKEGKIERKKRNRKTSVKNRTNTYSTSSS